VKHVEVEGQRIATSERMKGRLSCCTVSWGMLGRLGVDRSLTFSDEFTVVAWDVPSAGRSSDPPASFTLPDSTLVLEFPTAAGLGKLRRQPFIGMPGCLAG
jgi:hypothetical protein